MRRDRESREFGELVSILEGIGLLVMSIDRNLERMLILLGGEDDEETDA